MQKDNIFSILEGFELVKKKKPNFGARMNIFSTGKSSLNTSQLLAFYTLFVLNKNEELKEEEKKEIYGLYIFNEIKALNEHTSWKMSHSCLYPVLARLESESLIVSHKSETHGRKRIYEITKAGQREFRLQKKTYHQELLSSSVFYQQIMSKIYGNCS